MTSNKRNLKENKVENQGQGQIRKNRAEAATGGVLYKGTLINIEKFTEKHLCQSQAEACNFNKNKTLT